MLLGLATAAAVAAPSVDGRPCPAPTGHRIVGCRVAAHGTPDLGRRAFRDLRGQEVTISERIHSLAPNPLMDGARDWLLIDSLGLPVARIASAPGRRLTATTLEGRVLRATSFRIRGRGCAAAQVQQRTHALVQVIVRGSTSGGTQAFVDERAINRTSASGRVAYRALRRQLGGGTGCGPARPVRGRMRPLADPDVGATAHARLSNGAINGVTEYDAKPDFANVVYFNSNTTSVRVGGIARGMVRVGTPVRKVDEFRDCDPSSDGTLRWRYWAIETGRDDKPRLYGWIPGKC